MTYHDSWLWKRAFIENRDDASREEQVFFRNMYCAMRTKVSHLVSLISNDLPLMTVHDVTHCDALWEMGSIVTDDSVDLNPPEAFVFGASALIHDAAMTVSAYSGGLQELKEQTAWKDAVARLRMEARDRNSEEDDSEIEKTATEETLRLLHAKRAETLATSAWLSEEGENEECLIDDPTIRSFYGPTIGRVAHSHWWSVAKISDELANDLGPLGGKTNCSIDLVKVACLLRISDAIHIDSRRAPSFLRLLVKPKGISDYHWAFQSKLAVPMVKHRALQYSAASPFNRGEAEAWWLAYDAISLIDKELRDVDYLLQKQRRDWRYSTNRVEGANSPREMSRYIETDGWDPVDCAVRVSDVPKIVGALGGEKLYGSDSSCALRELIQNGADAVVMRRSIQQRDLDWGSISIWIERRGNENWLLVEDTGVGMSPSVLTGPLVDFGNSFWRSPLAASEFPGIHAAGVSTVGRYGIGFFAVFMLGKRVLVSSRRYDKANDSARTLEFQNGLGSRPILYETPDGGVPLDGGTRVEVCLEHGLREKEGILASNRFGISTTFLRDLIGSLAPNLNVDIYVAEESEEKQRVVRADDWLDLEDSQLLSRLASPRYDHDDKVPEFNARLRRLVGPDNQIYGRASIRKPRWGDDKAGCVSVGGLRASSINWIYGLFQGRETTASRNAAVVDVPPGVLSEWATEQADLLESAKLQDETKAFGAAVVLLCGGNIGDLPIARYHGEWHSTDALKNALEELDEVAVVFENEIEYDEEIDEVHPREFSDWFEESKEVVFVPDDFPGTETSHSVEKLFAACQAGDPKAALSSVFRKILDSVWVHPTEITECAIVGSVSHTEIKRDLTKFFKYCD